MGRGDELVVLAHLNGGKPVGAPPVPPVAERCAERIVRRAFVLPPADAIREPHGMKAGDGLPGFEQALNLVGKPSRSRIIVVVEVGNHVAGSVLASVISLGANFGPT